MGQTCFLLVSVVYCEIYAFPLGKGLTHTTDLITQFNINLEARLHSTAEGKPLEVGSGRSCHLFQLRISPEDCWSDLAAGVDLWSSWCFSVRSDTGPLLMGRTSTLVLHYCMPTISQTLLHFKLTLYQYWGIPRMPFMLSAHPPWHQRGWKLYSFHNAVETRHWGCELTMVIHKHLWNEKSQSRKRISQALSICCSTFYYPQRQAENHFNAIIIFTHKTLIKIGSLFCVLLKAATTSPFPFQ